MMRRKGARAAIAWISFLGTILGVALVLLSARGSGGRAREAAPRSLAEGADRLDRRDGREADPPAALGAGAGTLPLGRGLPVRVNVAVYFLEVAAFDDAKGEYEATIDVRLRWSDPRLAYPVKEVARGYREAHGKVAEEQLAKMWSPTVDARNRVETAPYVGRRLRVYPGGLVESLTRTTGRYKVKVGTESFPFDRQRLAVELIVRDHPIDQVTLRFETEDVEFSDVARSANLDGWDLGLVDLHRSSVAGWNGDRFSVVTATLLADRDAASTFAPVFVPLIASLLIPLVALWMNRVGEETLEIEGLELAAIGVGGLVSVIVLSFAITSANPIIASGDNTVRRLFSLNYASLALAVGVVVVFSRFELPRRWAGRYVQREAFVFIAWALPLLSFATSVAFVLVAAS